MARPAAAVSSVPAPVCLIQGDDDFAVKQRARQLFQQWSEELGGMDHETIDAQVNNAGEAVTAPFQKTDDALWHRMLGVNLTGVYACIREGLPDMLDAGFGRIVTVASTAGLRGYRYGSAYVAAKHGVIGLTRALALEVAERGITVNAVCPGYTDTDLVRDAIANITSRTGRSADEAREALIAGNPQRRMIQPVEVAQAVVWLCAPGTESVTGQSLAIAGGEVM